jgi:hypothetical protein
MSKFQRFFNILVTLVLVLLLAGQATNRKPLMSVYVDGANDYVQYPSSALVLNLSALSVCAWINPSELVGHADGFLDFVVGKTSQNYNNDGWLLSAGDYGNSGIVHTVSYDTGFAVGVGSWHGPNNALVVGQWQHICVTHQRSSTVTQPAIYVNGAAIAVTNELTGTGAAIDNNEPIDLGGYPPDVRNCFHGYIADVRIYNRIITPAEVLEIYSTRSLASVPYGLVFRAPITGAVGLQSFNGVTLGATNYLPDDIQGLLGVPTNSPLGYSDSWLNYGSVDDGGS